MGKAAHDGVTATRVERLGTLPAERLRGVSSRYVYRRPAPRPTFDRLTLRETLLVDEIRTEDVFDFKVVIVRTPDGTHADVWVTPPTSLRLDMQSKLVLTGKVSLSETRPSDIGHMVEHLLDRVFPRR